jgi:DNA mismatch endonuclease (patch repair protein)
MTDVHEPHVRSYNMSRIRSKNSKPELVVRKFLHANGLRFRLHDNKLPGKPDIVLKKYRTVIFVHGCFWHGHEGCRYFVIPKSNTHFWVEKITNNKTRDHLSINALKKNKWKVIELWECQIKSQQREKVLINILKRIAR